jgi:NitT/TauT family transport system permease protein
MEQIAALLKRTMPFHTVSDAVLAEITALASWRSYARGDVVYQEGDPADDIYVVGTGSVQHTLSDKADATQQTKIMETGDVFGWAAVLKDQPNRMATTTCLERTELIRINADALMKVLMKAPATYDVVMSRFATMITKEFSVSQTVAKNTRHMPSASREKEQSNAGMANGWALTKYRMSQWLASPKPYLMLIGFGLLLGFWHMAVEVWGLPRFRDMPSLTAVVTEWFSKDPVYGLSAYTPEYYEHIWVSVRRVGLAFLLATLLGVPLGLFLGWSKKFREFVFPIFETLRPIPILAWVPLAILMFSGSETPVIFLTFLASFFATALNTMLGVESIDESYSRAARCLGASRWQVFREVIVPGSMPFIFTGLQISVGVAWFSLVAGEMVSGQFGLGYVINTSYTMVRYPTIVIGMITLGAVGYITSTMVRMTGDYMMQWRVRELALGGR